MAFVISRQPTYIRPAHNELTFVVQDSNYALTDYKYIFETYINDTLRNTSKLFPRPDGTCHFDTSSIVQQYTDGYYNPLLIDYSEGNPIEVVKYKVKFLREWNPGTGLTQSTLSNGLDKYAWNGSITDFEEGKNVSTTVGNYMPNVITPSKLLNYIYCGESEKRGIKLYENDKRSVSFLRRNAAGDSVVVGVSVRTKTHTGETKVFWKEFPGSTSLPGSCMSHFPLGITELNNIGWTSKAIPFGLSDTIKLDEDYGMVVEFVNNLSQNTHKLLYFTFYEDPCKYDHCTIAYRTSIGGYGYINFDKKHINTINVEKKTFDKKLPYNYSTRDRVQTVYSNLITEEWDLSTDWLLNDDMISEIKDMLMSSELWLVKDGISIPVIYERGTMKIHNYGQDGMTYYQIKFKEAHQKNAIK